MRKFLVIIMSVSMCFCAIAPCLAAIPESNPTVKKTVTSTIDVKVGTKVDATFICNSISNSNLTLKSNKNTTIASMYDNGKSGDTKSYDGVCSASVSLYSDSRKTETYYAYDGDKLVSTYTVNYYNELTESDFSIKDNINNQITAIENSDQYTSEKDTFDAVYDFLTSCNDVCDVNKTATSISYTTNAGITSVYTHFDGKTKGTITKTNSQDIVEPSNTTDEILCWTNPNVLVLRPFRNSTDSAGGGFQTDIYLNAARRIISKTGGKIFTYDDEEANPYNFADNLDKVGFLLIDSHGIDIEVSDQMNSFIVMQNVNNDGITSADWSAGRVVDMYNGGYIAVSGEYIRAHYTEENRKLENTICYLGICLGMKYDSIKVPFTDMGARCVMGYTETVSIWYDNNMLNAISTNLVKTSTTDAMRTLTIAESIADAKIAVGYDEDPAGWGAVLEVYGNDNVAIKLADNHPTSISFSNTTYEAIINQDTVIPTVVLANTAEAHGYTQEWTSSDETVAKVVGPRTIKGISEGTATITCKIIGFDYELENSCTITVKYVEAESLKLTIGRKTVSAGTVQKAICTVYPRNASERAFTLRSTNTGCITVSGTSILAIAAGSTTIIATTATGIVSELDMSVSTKTVYQKSDVSDLSGVYALVFSEDGANYALSSSVEDGYIDSYSISIANGFIATSLSGTKFWSLKKADSGFYICNNSTGMYLFLNEENEPEFTESPQSIFAFDGSRLKVINTESEACYLRYRNEKGFCFSKKTLSSDASAYIALDFNDPNAFNIVTFKANDSEYTQYVHMGDHAKPVFPKELTDYTFLGWDAPLCDIKSSFTTNALYRSGTTDNIVITFMDSDGSVIETQELKQGVGIIPPTISDKTFSHWSENAISAQYNMTIFAIYNDGILGDATLDGIVNTGDAVLILRYSAEMETLDDLQLSLGDFTGDGIVNTGDAVAILKSLI